MQKSYRTIRKEFYETLLEITAVVELLTDDEAKAKKVIAALKAGHPARVEKARKLVEEDEKAEEAEKVEAASPSAPAFAATLLELLARDPNVFAVEEGDGAFAVVRRSDDDAS